MRTPDDRRPPARGMRAIWSKTIGEGSRCRRSAVSTIWSPSIWIWTCQPRSLTRFDNGSSMSIVVARRLITRLKRMPRMPRPSSRLSSASVTLASTTATPRAVAPSLAIASRVHGIVRAVGRRRDHDVCASCPIRFCKQAIVVDGRIRRPELGVWRDRESGCHKCACDSRRRSAAPSVSALRSPTTRAQALASALGTAESRSRHDRCSHRSQQSPAGDVVAHLISSPGCIAGPVTGHGKPVERRCNGLFSSEAFSFDRSPVACNRARLGATIPATSARSIGNSSNSNQGLRFSQALFRHEG